MTMLKMWSLIYTPFLGEQYFADRDIFCAGRVTEEDLQRVAAATGGTVQTSINNVIDEVPTSCSVRPYFRVELWAFLS